MVSPPGSAFYAARSTVGDSSSTSLLPNQRGQHKLTIFLPAIFTTLVIHWVTVKDNLSPSSNKQSLSTQASSAIPNTNLAAMNANVPRSGRWNRRRNRVSDLGLSTTRDMTIDEEPVHDRDLHESFVSDIHNHNGPFYNEFSHDTTALDMTILNTPTHDRTTHDRAALHDISHDESNNVMNLPWIQQTILAK